MPILSVTELPWPSDWPGIFGVDRPLCLEIGFGDGRYLEFLAQREPRWNVLGLEISHRSLTKAERLLSRYPNLRVLHSSAELAFSQLFSSGELAEVHINFPDPWFKQGHQGRRLLRSAVLPALLNRMAAGANLYLATDVLPYAESVAALLQDEAALTNLSETPWAQERPLGPATKYEQRARQAGRSCYYFAYRRDDAVVAEPKRIEEWAMPHLVYHSPLSLAETQREFERQFAPRAVSGRIHPETEAHLHYLAAYGAKEALLFEVFVREGALHQRLALHLARQRPQTGVAEERYTLSLSGIGHPRATPGCHLALAVLGRWLLRLHPEARIIHQRVRGWDDAGNGMAD